MVGVCRIQCGAASVCGWQERGQQSCVQAVCVPGVGDQGCALRGSVCSSPCSPAPERCPGSQGGFLSLPRREIFSLFFLWASVHLCPSRAALLDAFSCRSEQIFAGVGAVSAVRYTQGYPACAPASSLTLAGDIMSATWQQWQQGHGCGGDTIPTLSLHHRAFAASVFPGLQSHLLPLHPRWLLHHSLNINSILTSVGDEHLMHCVSLEQAVSVEVQHFSSL